MKDFLLLDWESLKKQLLEYLSTESAKYYLQTYHPSIEPSKASLFQEKSKFFWKKIEKGEVLELPPLPSLSKLYHQARRRGFFLVQELSSLVLWLRTAFNLSIALQDSPFEISIFKSEIFSQLLERIMEILEVEKGEIRSEASYELYLVRREKNRLAEELFYKLNKIKERFFKLGYLQDNIFLQKEGRYVLPVKPEFKSKVKGIYHGYSQSGATLFVEPFGIVELTNALEELSWKEEIIIQRLLKSLSEEIFPLKLKLLELENAMVDVDFALAKVKLGRVYRGVFPEIVAKKELVIKGGFHPLLYFKAVSENKELPIPNDYYFKEALLITGPNFGGKTVSLKTIGILVFMALNGFLIPAKEAQVPLFRKILVDLGDEQNLLEGESSFSAHLKNLKRIVEEVDSESLILLDEPGRGTNFEEGSALVLACVEKFLDQGARVVITTHSPFIKAYALEDKRFSYAMVKDYKLLYGYLGESHAFELAQKFGFDKDLLESAKSFLRERGGYDYYEKYINEAQRLEILRKDLERKLQELEKEKRDLVEYKGKLQREYEEKWENLLKSWHFEFKQLLESLKDSSKGKAKRAFEKFLEEKDIPFREEEQRFEKGERVFVSSLQKEGIIERVKEKSAEVLIGQIKLEIPLYQLKRKEKGNFIPPLKNPNFYQFGESKSLSFREKIVLLGEDIESALVLLERKLNECFLQGKKILLVVHGHGSGKLRAAIRSYLKEHPLVERFEEPPLYEGGSGATLVYLFNKN